MAAATAAHRFAAVDPAYRALSLYRRRRYDDCIDLCSQILEQKPLDQSVWVLKVRAMTEQAYIDDVMDVEDEGVAEILLDENATSQVPRPGTSLRPLTSSGGNDQQAYRPVSSSGRPVTGYQRPGTNAGQRPTTGDIGGMFQGDRPGTSRPVTSSGRFVRLGTASMVSDPNGEFIDVNKMDLAKYAQRPALAKALCDYLLYHAQNPRSALELCSHATVFADYKDWWWKARLGKCYYKLGLLRDAEKQFKSALKTQEMVTTYLELAKVYIRLDRPPSALDAYLTGASVFEGEVSLLIGAARIYDALGEVLNATSFYKKALHFDNANVEAVACIASNHFYEDQPEIALRYYRRLLQMGVTTAELWTNLGLCCFFAQQYDMCVTCFERALALANDDTVADVWYNLGQIAMHTGDVNLAYQAFKVVLTADPNHAEAFNDLGVLEARKGAIDQARSLFSTAYSLNPHVYQALFNGALISYRLGDFQDSFNLVEKALGVYKGHVESKQLLQLLREQLLV